MNLETESPAPALSPVPAARPARIPMTSRNVVRLHLVSSHLKPFIKQHMVYAKDGCYRCYGRGYKGINLTTKKPQPCNCLMLDLDQLKAAVAAAQEKLTLEQQLVERFGKEASDAIAAAAAADQALINEADGEPEQAHNEGGLNG